MAVSLVGLIVLASPGSAADEQQVAGVERKAYFTRPATAATPPLLLDGFPPATACLVAGLAGAPELCGEQIADITDTLGLGGGVPVPETIDAELVQPVAPGTLPVGMNAGEERYSSLLAFSLPALPPGEQFGTLELLLRPDGLSYAAESPAFREAVLATVSQISDQDPAAFAEVLGDVASGDLALYAEAITGIEACPVLEPWDGGDAQNAGLEGQRLPDADCLLGTTGEFDTETSTWVFDLTFAAQAWTTGGLDDETLANQGIILRPLGAENLAYGDPDMSTNWLVSLADDEASEDLQPRLRWSTVPELEEIEAAAPTAAPTQPAPPPPPAPAAPETQTVETPAPAPEVALPGIQARWADRSVVPTSSTSPWWLALLVPLGLLGAWLLGESVFAVPGGVRSQPGALDRLTRLDRRPEGEAP